MELRRWGEGEGLRKECKATVWVDRRDNGDGDSGRVLGSYNY